MKKGLLSILAGALVVVGCQNYDDQFDSLESQINALASTVAGLSQVQSDLSSLAGTVSSLSSTVASLGSAIDTAVSNGLADITADIAALQSALADVASSEDVTAISDAVAEQQASLDELLANSSVFSGDVTINSVATLDAFHAMGSGLAIVNGNVTFDVSTDMDATKVQEVADQILTITKDFSYTGASATTVPTFKNLSGVQSLTMKAPGDYRFDGLVTATKIVLNNDNASKIGIVHFGALKNYTQINDDAGIANTISLSNTTEFHFGSVARLASDKLNITLKKGSVLDISGVTGLDADGDVVKVDLDINGPASFVSSKIADGDINVSNVATVNISGFYGKTTVGTGVSDLTTSKAVTLDISSADDLQTATIDVALDWDPELTATAIAANAKAGGPTVEFKSQDLTTATVTGAAGTIKANAQNNLTSLTVKSTGAGDLTLTSNTDLETLVVTGSTLNDITITGNNNLTSLTLDHTTGFLTGSTQKGVAVNISNNTDLESLTFSADNVDDLTVKGNDDLTTVNFTGLSKIGEATAEVDITDNKLSASKAVDTYQDADGDGTAEAGDGEGTEEGTKTDKGSYTTDSGLKTLSTYLTAAVAAPGTDGVIVAFDSIDVSVDEAKESANNTENTSVTVTQNAANAGSVWYVAYVTKAGDDTPAKYETQTSVGELPLNSAFFYSSEGAYKAANNDGITVTYPQGGAVSFKINTSDADLDTWDELVTYFNTNADREGFDLTLSNDGNEARYYSITFVDSAGAAEVISATGTIIFDISSTVTGLSALVTANDDYQKVNAAIAAAINAGTNSYTASVVSQTGSVSRVIKIVPNIAASTIDKTPLNKYALPSAITVSWTGGTASFSAAGTNANHGSSFVLSWAASAVTNGWMVVAKNTSLTEDKADLTIAAAGNLGTASALAAGSFFNNGNIDGSATTTVDSEIGAYVRSFANASALVAGAKGEDTNRISWLG